MGGLSLRTLAVVAGLSASLLAGCEDQQRDTRPRSDIVITDAVLVAPRSGAASLSAKFANGTGQEDEIARISARRGVEPLSVYQPGHGIHLIPGVPSVLSSSLGGEMVVVRCVEPGQSVRVTFTFMHAPDQSLDVPVVADAAKYEEVNVWRQLPTITNGRFVVVPGQRCAFAGFTIDGHGGSQHASLDDITVTGPDGRDIAWKHVTATGGPADVFASAEPMDWAPAVMAPGEVCDEPGSGDADYIEAADVKVGETVTVAIEFPVGVVRAPFRIVAG